VSTPDQVKVFLVAEPEVLGYIDLQDRLGSLIHGATWPTIRVPVPVAKLGAWLREKVDPTGKSSFIKPWMIDLADDHYPVDISRARERLGWKPERRLDETLRPMVARLLVDPQRWYEENGLPVPKA